MFLLISATLLQQGKLLAAMDKMKGKIQNNPAESKFLPFINPLFCSPINCFHSIIAKRSLCQQLKSSMGDIMTSLIPTMWPSQNLFQM